MKYYKNIFKFLKFIRLLKDRSVEREYEGSKTSYCGKR